MLTFVGFKQLMREKRELTTKEKAELTSYFQERQESLAFHEIIVRDIKLELLEINKRLDKLP